MCLAAALLAGCGHVSAPEPASPQVTTFAAVVAADGTMPSSNALNPSVPVGMTLRRHTWGGMCAGGACSTSLDINWTGAWTYVDNGVTRTGTLTQDQMVALAKAAAVTRLDKATGTPDCAADHDGTSVAYSWTLGGVTRSASSCDHPIDRSDSLAIQLERVADTVIH